MAKTPRGGAIALPIPTQEDIDRCAGQTPDESEAFARAIMGIPQFNRLLESIRMNGAGPLSMLDCMVVLNVLNETFRREMDR